MKKQLVVFGLLVSGICLFVFSCKHEIPVAPTPVVAQTYCFEEDVLPIFQSNCTKSGCHDSVTRQAGHQFDRYSTLVVHGIIAGDSSGSEIYEVITSTDPLHSMPQPPNQSLTPAQIHTIAVWIQEGANNTTNCAKPCDSSNVSFSGTVQPIIENHCRGCHGGFAIDGGFIPLSTYDDVKQRVEYDKLLPAITHTGAYPMPKIGDKLSDCKIAKIRKWIEAGAPNN